MRTEPSWPGPPASRTWTPGVRRTTSASVTALRAVISSPSITLTAFDVSSVDCGRPEAVTTTDSRTPAAPSSTSWVTAAVPVDADHGDVGPEPGLLDLDDVVAGRQRRDA